MLIPLPDLDDRRWTDLVEESRALIPVLAPEWTDHNASDPGVTLIELFAWLAEIHVYRANLVTDAARRRFLALAGVAQRPPAPARTVLAVSLVDGATSVRLRAGTELETVDTDGGVTGFRTVDDLTVVPGELRAVYAVRGHGVRDLSGRPPGAPVAPFDDDPTPETRLYLGFTRPLPAGAEATLYASIEDSSGDAVARAALLAELVPDPACEPVELPCDCVDGVVAAPVVVRAGGEATRQSVPLRHHSVELAWEIRTPAGTWQRLADRDEVVDETRSLTLDGRILLRPPAAMAAGAEDGMDPSLAYVRCRIAAGAFDRPPLLSDLSLNAVAAVQAVAPRVPPERRATLPGAPMTPAERLAAGTGQPWQRRVLADRIVVADSLTVQSIEGGATRTWERRADFDASSGADAHLLLDPLDGAITFGDGDRGRVVPAGAEAFAAYLVTRAEAGNREPLRAFRLAAADRNPELAPQDATAVVSATSVVAARGGAPAETLEHAEGRALEALSRVTRAVTLRDIEELACATPGTAIARATAVAGLFGPFPCVDAAGMVTVVVIPWLPARRPTPSAGLLRAVRASLARRRLVGTRIEVTAPTYLEVSVRATVAADPGVARDALRGRVREAIERFFDPLAGGPDGTGWPLGRDVYRTEVLDVINRVEGVARVEALELVAAGCDVCTNVCIGRTGLVASGRHEITVGPAR